MAVTTSNFGTRQVVAESHAGGAGKILAGVGRAIHEQKFEKILQFQAVEVSSHQALPAVESTTPAPSGATANTS